jgi:hypothetical protein
MLKTTEINHPIIKPLLEKSDRELLALFQSHLDLGQYLVAIFCKYGQITYTLTSDSGRSPREADYLFAKTWERIYQELKSSQIETIDSLQNFLIDITGVEINSANALNYISEDIKYDLSLTPPIFFCYLNQALDQLSPDLRLVLILFYRFNWSGGRIAAYLQSEGDLVQDLFRLHKIKDMNELISKADLALIQLLPQDIQKIYLSPA